MEQQKMEGSLKVWLIVVSFLLLKKKIYFLFEFGWTSEVLWVVIRVWGNNLVQQ
jgi:hypothetical protein